MKNMLFLFWLTPLWSFSQINGTIIDEDLREPVYGALIVATTGEKAKSDADGKFVLSPGSYPVQLVVSAQTFENDTIIINGPGEVTVIMAPPVQEIQTIVVSAGRHDQDIEDVPVSMEILRPELIDNKGVPDLEAAVNQTPGVYAMDGNVSIRGGSGYAYGVGSRVLVLWNGMPMLSGYAGDAQWDAIPMESAAQIEIMKGASSVLYGSGALNGVIALREREPSTKGETRIKLQSGIYGNPRRSTLQWWGPDSTLSRNPMFHQWDAYYGKMKKSFGYTFSTNGYLNEGYRQGEKENRARVSGSLFFKPQKRPKVKAGLGYNLQFQKKGTFLIWQSDTFAYTPSGGADTTNPASTLTINGGTRFSIDPYVKWYDKKNNLHNIKTRYYFTKNATGNEAQSSKSGIFFTDYQFQRKWGKGVVLTSGATGIYNVVKSQLFGDHNSANFAIYSQYEHRFDKLDLTGGVRLEYFEMDGESGDSDFRLGNQSDSTAMTVPLFPIIRLGAHYQIAKYTHLRASFGQGVRYPSVAERYTQTAVGALLIFPNANLKRERGWAAEIGIKQAVKISKGWKGIFDVSGFVNQYDDMVEFTFGNYIPYEDSLSGNPSSPWYFMNWLGFSAQNAESATIAGFEFSFNSVGKIGEVELLSLLGYTYMNPISKNTDSEYLQTLSTYEQTIDPVSGDTSISYNDNLKYRFNHLIRADIEATWKSISLGISCRYNSFMTNIDALFEDGFAGQQILPGLKQYRQINNKGGIVFDVRAAYSFKEHYRVSLMVNNFLNAEYEARPGDIQAPATFIAQLQMKF